MRVTVTGASGHLGGSLVRALLAAGHRNVARACLDAGVGRLVHFSSIDALAQAPLDRPLGAGRPSASWRGWSRTRRASRPPR